jgi:hypothetical protein
MSRCSRPIPKSDGGSGLPPEAFGRYGIMKGLDLSGRCQEKRAMFNRMVLSQLSDVFQECMVALQLVGVASKQVMIPKSCLLCKQQVNDPVTQLKFHLHVHTYVRSVREAQVINCVPCLR